MPDLLLVTFHAATCLMLAVAGPDATNPAHHIEAVRNAPAGPIGSGNAAAATLTRLRSEAKCLGCRQWADALGSRPAIAASLTVHWSPPPTILNWIPVSS